MIVIQKVETDEQISRAERLAGQIWRQHYTPIIGPAQVDYMLERFQCADAIRAQLTEGHEYFLAIQKGRDVGYIAFLIESNKRALFLSKIYTRRSARGHGAGREMLALAERRARESDAKKIWLTVNKHNTNSIAWYTRMGFVVTDTLLTDIGGGFVMDDYLMEKPLH